MSLKFRWLGVAGVELKTGGQVLALDPFFTRPSLMGFIRPIAPNTELVAEKMPKCDFVLVTHSHWDHLMDVPEVLHHTGAVAYGSPNTCQLLNLLGVPGSQVIAIRQGDNLSLGAYDVEVIPGQHSPIPFGWIFNGRLRPDLQPPLRIQDYRMDVCLGFSIQACGVRCLVSAAVPQPADVLFTIAQEPRDYYLRLFQTALPHTFVPIHWDNFMRPLSKSLRRFTRPGRLTLSGLTKFAHQALPLANVIIPEIFREYSIEGREWIMHS
jgi:hypothetical protein